MDNWSNLDAPSVRPGSEPPKPMARIARVYPEGGDVGDIDSYGRVSTVSHYDYLPVGLEVEVIDEGYAAATVIDPRNRRQWQVPYQYISMSAGTVPWIDVASTNVDAIRYLNKKVFRLLRESVLQIRFLDGSIYEYPGVTEAEWDDFFSGGKDASYGGWVWDELRWPNRPYRKLRGPTGAKKPPRRHDPPLRRDRGKPAVMDTPTGWKFYRKFN